MSALTAVIFDCLHEPSTSHPSLRTTERTVFVEVVRLRAKGERLEKEALKFRARVRGI